MERYVIVECEARNVAPRFCHASWRIKKVGLTYPSIAEARRHHRLQNCHYTLWQSDERGVRLLREVDNISNNRPRMIREPRALYMAAGIIALAMLANIVSSIII